MNGKAKVEGTYFTDGMLQGRVPNDRNFEKNIQEWLAAQRKNGLRFDFTIDGGSFNLLADDKPNPSRNFPPDGVQEHLAAAFQKLIELSPPSERLQLMSTLRSVEYRPGAEIQTLYIITPPGKIIAKQRTLDAETIAPPPELTLAGRLKLGALGLVVAAILLLVSSFFIDWKTWLFEPTKELVPVKLEEIILDAQAFEGFLAFEKRALDKQRRGLRLLAKTGPDWKAAMDSQPSDFSSWPRFLAVASIKKSLLRCDFYDRKENPIASVPVSLPPLLQSKTNKAELFLPLPNRKVHRIVIAPL